MCLTVDSEKMKNLIFAVGMLLLLSVFAGCKKNKPDPPTSETSLHLKVSAFFGDQPLEFGPTYHNVSGYRLNVSDFKLYLSHLFLVDQEGDTVNLTDVAFFNLTSGANTLIVDHLGAGNYSKIGFGIGVAPDLNSPQNEGSFNIALFDHDHPLSNSNNMFWSWAGGYRFVVFDGKYDTDTQSTEPMIDGYSFHTGGDDAYREVVFENIDFTLSEESTTAWLDFQIDRFFYNDTDTIDISVQNQAHAPNQPLGLQISDNIQHSVSFRQ